VYKQNTPEWLEMRKNKIGASDAPIIMNQSPYKTPHQLWQEKLDLVSTPKSTVAMDRGVSLEESARHEFEKMTGLKTQPKVVFHPHINYMMASLDAVDPQGKNIAEIKCPGKEDHALAQAGKIPGKYYPQLQHQLEVSELEMAYYFSFDGSQGVIVKVFRNDKYIDTLLKKEKEFWEKLQTFEAPELTERDYELKEDLSWTRAACLLRHARSELVAAQEKEMEARARLIELSNDRNCMGDGVKLTKVITQGRIDYKAINELKDLNLEIYRKKPTESWRITTSQ
jgi:putative phage-type endonuclease